MAHVNVGEPCIVRISQWDNAGPAFFKAWIENYYNGGYTVRLENGERQEVSVYDIGLYDELTLEDLQSKARALRKDYEAFDHQREMLKRAFSKVSGY